MHGIKRKNNNIPCSVTGIDALKTDEFGSIIDRLAGVGGPRLILTASDAIKIDDGMSLTDTCGAVTDAVS